MSTLAINSETLINIADAIRAKTGKSESITPIDMPKEIGNLAIGSASEIADTIINKSITQFTSSALTKIGTYAFCDCNKLTSVNAPNVEFIDGAAFRHCEALTEVNFPNVTELMDEAFSYCTALEKADFSNLEIIRSSAFANCSTLWLLILRSEHPCELVDNSVFENTPIENSIGGIFVPSILVEEYKALPNWETYAEKIFAIEDYPEIQTMK